jgi:hypothetical protein
MGCCNGIAWLSLPTTRKVTALLTSSYFTCEEPRMCSSRLHPYDTPFSALRTVCSARSVPPNSASCEGLNSLPVSGGGVGPFDPEGGSR